ncbi:MAG: hypothetical protein ABSG53_32710, partial [Thermoguttaceae bacterium]|jgi:hypothetical protein
MTRLIRPVFVVAICILPCLVATRAAEPDGKPLEPCVVITGPDSRVTECRYHRITSDEEWTRVWREHTGQKPAAEDDPHSGPITFPSVDFNHYMVVAIFQGNGWNSRGLRAVSISENDQRITFRFEDQSYQTLSREGSGEGANKVTVYGFFVVPRSKKPVVLEENVQQYLGQPPVWKERITFPKL